jgi:hypothetical protein
MRCCVFRRDKTLPIDADLVNALYRGVLRREPDAAEIDSLIKALSNAGSVEQALKDMLSSHEFGVMVLPDVLNSYVTRIPDHPVFFLHVPKTAGTSFRLALADAMGVPAFLLYVRTSWLGFGENATMDFWPLWAGHAGVSAFPKSHRGITIFRESRSRVLSHFRQIEREIATGDPSGPLNERFAHFNMERKTGITVQDGFSRWVSQARSVVQWFIEAPHTEGAYFWNGRPTGEFLDSLSPAQARRSLTRSFQRFDAAAWSHDSDAMRIAISRVANVQSVAPIRHENQYVSLSDEQTTRLTVEDLTHLNRIADDEKVLFDIAVGEGLIPPLDPDFADAEFEKNAKRLGFILP